MAQHQRSVLLPLALALCLALAAEGQNGRELVGEEQGSYMARALAGLQSGAGARQTSGTASAIVKPKMVKKVKGTGPAKAKGQGAVKRGAAAASTNVTVAHTHTNTTGTHRNSTVTPRNTTVTHNPVAPPTASPPPPAPNPPFVAAEVAQWRAFRTKRLFAKPANKNTVANIGRTWSYSFRLDGADVVGPQVEQGDAKATGTVNMSVTMLEPSLFSDAHPTYRIKVSIKLKSLQTSGLPTKAVLKRGSQHTEGKMLLAFPGAFAVADDGAVLETVVGDTSAVWSEFQVPSTAAMEYLIEYSGHHYVEVWTTQKPKGALRGQLVKVPEGSSEE